MARWREIMAGDRCVFVVLLCDSVLWLSLWGGQVLCDCSTSGGLLGLWAYAAVRWTILYSLAWMLTDGKPQCALNRWVALLCLLPPVFESGRSLVDPQPHAVPLWRGGLIPEPSTVILSTILYVVAWVWEVDVLGGGGGGAKGDVKKVDARKVLTRVVTFFRPDVPHLILAFSFLIGAVICDTFIPFYQGRVIDMLSGQHLHTSFTQEIIHLSLFSIGSMLCSGLRGSMFMLTLSRLNRRMKRNLFHSFLQQEIHFFEDNKPGELSSRLSSDVDRMGRAVALNSNALVRGLVKASLMLVLMLSLSWELTVLTCIEMPLLALIQKKYTTYSQEVKEKVQESQAKNAELAKQTIEGIRVVRSFKGEKVEVKRYNDALEEMCNIKRRKDITSAVYRLIRRMVSLGIKILMLFYGRKLLVSGQLSIGSLLTFFLYQKPMTANMREILYGIGETMSTVGVINKVLNYLDRKPQCKEAGELAPEKLEGRVTFKNVSFAYPSTPDKPALKSVSMELCPGKITALVGPSGGGKTSCVSLLNRLYDPQEGVILLDGQPLHHYKHKYLHQKVALVSQNPELFSGSVSYNIKYGLRDCTEEKVKEAARRAKVEAFSQLDADVGERGGSLAAGQKQCIAFARALVRQPQVIILDEATSNLDVDIQNSVAQEIMTCGQTVLVVAHQLKTVEHWAHHIIYMENGRIVEQGTHQELMANKDRYHRLKEGLFSYGHTV